MEVLAGAADEHRAGQLRQLLVGRCAYARTEGPIDYERAARLQRTRRRAGETVRRLTDCLIAAVALRAGAEILHRDADFDVLARHTPLRVTGATEG